MMLPMPEILANLTLQRDCNVRPKDKDDVAIVWYMMRESAKACLTNKRGATDATKGKNASPMILHQVSEATHLIVDFIRAYRCTKQRIFSSEAMRALKNVYDAMVNCRTGESAREVLMQCIVTSTRRLWSPIQKIENMMLHGCSLVLLLRLKMIKACFWSDCRQLAGTCLMHACILKLNCLNIQWADTPFRPFREDLTSGRHIHLTRSESGRLEHLCYTRWPKAGGGRHW
mmetsp:Transcript_96649/g.177679  ORF Transcript_96649/g.177679 Transcript_96649/m.177679 type:complete len:230 (-) Transcript_96649:331-1020(-)